VGGGTLQEVVDAVNAQSDLGVSATAVKVGDNAYRLQLASKTAGAANTVTVGSELNGMGSSWLTTSAASNARVTVGSGGNAYSISSASNSLDGVLPGVTIDLIKNGGPVTISSFPDSSALAGKLGALAAAVNAALAEIRTQTKYDPSTKKGSPLTGDGTVRDVQRKLVEAISNPVNGQYPDTFGLSISRGGDVVFDQAKFEAAYAKDPDATRAFFDSAPTGTDPGGLANKLVTAVDQATGNDGSLATVLKGRQQLVLDLQSQIDAYQIRLDKREAGLKAQFSALETTLGSLKNQSSWLSSQLGTSS
jgi:flagellar hook-associated protein 2